jgi:hypothetical protein
VRGVDAVRHLSFGTIRARHPALRAISAMERRYQGLRLRIVQLSHGLADVAAPLEQLQVMRERPLRILTTGRRLSAQVHHYPPPGPEDGSFLSVKRQRRACKTAIFARE